MAVAVKICGITDTGVARAAWAAGADYLGLVFYPLSPRHLAPREARALAEAAPGRWVAVFKDPTWQEIATVLAEVPVSGVQCHGKCPPHWILRVHERGLLAISTHLEETGADVWLLDGPQAGSGQAWAWRLPDDGRPYWIAGGLNPENVAAVVRRIRPAGVDVSSGVERDGKKDVGRVVRFIEEAKQA